MGAILLVDIEAFRFTDGNAAVIELFGYGKEELVTMQPNKLTAVPESDLRQFVGTFSANNGCSGGLKFTHKDKAPIYTEYTISKIEHDDSRILIISARDISKRKMREKELQEAKEAAEIALHEVKTLTGLLPICSGCKKIAAMRDIGIVLNITFRSTQVSTFLTASAPLADMSSTQN